MAIDTMNKFLVGVRGDGIVISLPPPGVITKQDALLLAAWLVTLAANDEGTDFDATLRAVQQ